MRVTYGGERRKAPCPAAYRTYSPSHPALRAAFGPTGRGSSTRVPGLLTEIELRYDAVEAPPGDSS